MIVVVSGMAAIFSGASPTGNGIADAIWNFLVGATLARATVDARRWTWFPMAGVSVVVASGWVAMLCGLGSLASVFAAGFFTHRRRWLGALAGGLAAQALLRGYSYGFTGLPTIVAFLACTPLLISAYRNASSQTRKVGRNVAVVGAIVVGVLTIFTAVSAMDSRTHIRKAIQFSDEAVAAAQAGDEIAAASLIGAAGEELDSVATDFSRPWLYPARFIPLLGPHVTVLGDVSDAGADVADQAADVLVALDPDAIIIDGEIDVAGVDSLGDPMAGLNAALRDAVEDIADIDTTWLAQPARERVDELVVELTNTGAQVETASSLVAIAPDMLGASGPRRYLVVFTTAAESRGAGGFAGNWAELVIDQGRIELAATGRSDEINDSLPPGGVTVERDLLRLYDGFELETTFQNIPVVPNFPTVARLARDHYEAAFGRTVDGVIGVDHKGMAGIIALTGPVEVDGRTLNADQAEQFILRDQYIEYGDDNDARIEVLDALTVATFERLVSTALPSPQRIVDIFEPIVAGNHLRVVSFDNVENLALDEAQLNDSFPVANGQDLLAVVTQNLGENKIDIFLDRKVEYSVELEPSTNRAVSTLRIALVNSAPSSGLPQAILGNNDQGLPEGTNNVRVQIYTPLELVAATLDGEEVTLVVEEELGWNRYHRDLWLDAGSAEVLEVQLDGVVDLDQGYVLNVEHQPLVNPDEVVLEVSGEKVADFSEIVGLDATGRASVKLESDQVVGLLLSG